MHSLVSTHFALEQQMRFIHEKWSELYKWYYSRISQGKIVYDAKKPVVSLATPESSLAGATCVIGGGCFWCLDAVFRQVKGVEKVVAGYAGGHTDNPSYDQMHTGDTGHAEVVQITFDPKIISYEQLLEIFFATHDPTTLNRQGNDIGPQYRSVILYNDAEQKKTAELAKQTAAKLWDDPIVTEIALLTKFWPAEEYHQDFFAKNPYEGYCQVIINPKLEKFRQKFPSLLK